MFVCVYTEYHVCEQCMCMRVCMWGYQYSVAQIGKMFIGAQAPD